MGFLAWLGIEDSDVTERKKKRKEQSRYAWRAEAGELRRGCDPDLPDICTGDFTGTVRVDGARIKFINGVRQ